MNCIYCNKKIEKKNKNVGEDAFQDFLLNYFDKQKKNLINYNNVFFSEKEGKIQEVCHNCNNGFLSEIDNNSSLILKELLDYIYEKHNNKIFIFNEEKKNILLKSLIKTYINRHIYYTKDANGNNLTYKNDDLDYNLYNFFYKYVENKFNISNNELEKYSIYIKIDKNKYTNYDAISSDNLLSYDDAISYEYKIVNYPLLNNFDGIHFIFKYKIPNIEIIVFYINYNDFDIPEIKQYTKFNKNIEFNKISIGKIHLTHKESINEHLIFLSTFKHFISFEETTIVLILDKNSVRDINFGNKYKINKNYILLDKFNNNVLDLSIIFKNNTIKDLTHWKLAISHNKNIEYEEKKFGFNYVSKYIQKTLKKIDLSLFKN